VDNLDKAAAGIRAGDKLDSQVGDKAQADSLAAYIEAGKVGVVVGVWAA
jgi:hypothetical protein